MTATARLAQQTEWNILAAVKEHGKRVTFPRRELAALIARWEGSFSSAEIVARVPTLGRATIYRTLWLFVDVGVLCKTELPSGSPRYSLDGVHHHNHLFCVSCERIDGFRHPSVERMVRTLANEVGGIVGHRLDLYHRCPRCTESNGR